MSWFSELAGRAEALLDKMDQAAATSLQGVGLTPVKEGQSSTPSPGQVPPNTSSHGSGLPYEPTAQPLPTASDTLPSFKPMESSGGGRLHVGAWPPSTSTSRAQATERPRATPFTSKTSQVDANDDSLFEFLNSPSKPRNVSSPSKPREGGREGVRKVASSPSLAKHMLPLPAPSSPIKVQPSVAGGPIKSQTWRDVGEERGGLWQAPVRQEEQDKKLERKTELDEEPLASGPAPTDEPDFAPLQLTPEPGEAAFPPVEGTDGERKASPSPSAEDQSQSEARQQAQLLATQQKVSNLELENRLLKREVASLNDELSGVMERMREARERVGQYESEIASMREQVSRSDHVIRELRSHEEDLQAMVEARDSQIQVLRSQFSEDEKTVEELRGQIADSQKDRVRLLQDVNLSSDAHNQALESLKAQLSRTQDLLEQEKAATAALKVEFAERESRLQLDQQQLSEALAVQQRQLGMQQAKAGESQVALQSAHNELQLLRKEHEEYKQRATGILQAKERLISSLQGGGQDGAREAKLEELRLEKEHVQAQLQTAQQHVQNLHAEIQELEERHGSEIDQLLEQVRLSADSLEEEKKSHAATQAELSQLSQEAEETRDSYLKEKTDLSLQLKDKEKELEALKTKVPSAGPANAGRVELESRLHELTESLIQKQTAIEALSSEKSSLNVQLKRLKDQLADAQSLHPPRVHTAVNGLDSVDSSSQAPGRIKPMSSVLPSGGRHLHCVRKAMNMVDSSSVRLVMFLRKYPLARLLVLIYVVLLHFWVTFVLLTYSPEVHDTTVGL